MRRFPMFYFEFGLANPRAVDLHVIQAGHPDLTGLHPVELGQCGLEGVPHQHHQPLVLLNL